MIDQFKEHAELETESETQREWDEAEMIGDEPEPGCIHGIPCGYHCDICSKK